MIASIIASNEPLGPRLRGPVHFFLMTVHNRLLGILVDHSVNLTQSADSVTSKAVFWAYRRHIDDVLVISEIFSPCEP
ncbi:unnamed protein product [Dibothriocephalus latus]|uniref:Uncharacterized protein n=1 Tax=Dibothriocephalus latus TaxID=60516 RepID=A0A3P7NTW0_DIBLA|nr:unnamed protein product [Dibothriocephalus latus]